MSVDTVEKSTVERTRKATSKPSTASSPTQKMMDVKRKLDAQPKERVYLRQVPDAVEPKLPDVPVIINGVMTLIKRGVPQDVPRDVARVLQQSDVINE